jgi:glycine/D-amino acid oxidase-like deaminating enzyme
MDCEVAPRSPALERSATADTVVIGSGIAGLSAAYELALRGQSVVVLDRGKAPGNGDHRNRYEENSSEDPTLRALRLAKEAVASKQPYEVEDFHQKHKHLPQASPRYRHEDEREPREARRGGSEPEKVVP